MALMSPAFLLQYTHENYDNDNGGKDDALIGFFNGCSIPKQHHNDDDDDVKVLSYVDGILASQTKTCCK